MKETLDKRIKRLMTSQGFNQTQLAKRTGIERTELNRIVNGRRSPKPEQISWIAEVLGLTIEELLRDVEVPSKVRKLVKPVEAAVQRAHAAERERDVANQRANALERRCSRLQTEIEEERKVLQAQVQAAQAQADERLQVMAAEHREGQRRQWDQMRVLRAQKEELAITVDQLVAENRALRKRVVSLEQQVASGNKGMVATGLLGALAGAALGRGFDGDDEDYG